MKTEDITGMNWERARNICIVKTLANLGHFPTKISEKEAWFLSPLRTETHASFNVSLVKNVWYDFGLGRGGSVIDLIMEMKSCPMNEALNFLQMAPVLPGLPLPSKRLHYQAKIEIISVKGLKHPGLISYVRSRKIPVRMASRYCKEVWYSMNNREYFAIGLPNHLGGWELRNKYYKNSSSPKSFSFIDHSSNRLLVTEGIFDFLTLAVLKPKLVRNSNGIVLNSLSFIKDVCKYFSKYSEVQLFLDHDRAGEKATEELLSDYDNTTDSSDCYLGFKDLNDRLKNNVKKTPK